MKCNSLETEVRLLHNQIATAKRSTTQATVCPTCKRPLEKGQVCVVDTSNLEAQLETAKNVVAKAEEDWAEKKQKLKTKIIEHELQLRSIEKVEDERQEQLQLLAGELEKAKQKQSVITKIEEAEDRIFEVDQELSIVETNIQKADINRNELLACEETLGLRGVRATLLSKALSGLETLANSWLNKLVARGSQVTLAPYSENKSGDQTDSISLSIQGPSCKDYGGCSSGQRRRIDIAFLFALAELSAAAFGVTPGTLFLDEVADALDQDGTDPLMKILVDLSLTRSIVMISHNDRIVSDLKNYAIKHFIVKEDGVFEV